MGKVINLPESSATVTVSVIDTTVRFQQWKIDPFVQEPKIAGHTHMTAPSWAFKIDHPSKGTYLFDLGVRKDWQDKLPTRSRNIVKKNNWTITIDKDVAQILTEHGENLDNINGIIWSHVGCPISFSRNMLTSVWWHWDHIGDPSTFPATVKLIVGPGFKKDILPGYPQNPEGRANSDAWADRELEEVSMPNDLTIGGYAALDFFEDGSFYLLDAPGHTVGHLCALARTTADPDPSFIFMGGDVAHTIGQYRPTEHIPLPDNIRPDPRHLDSPHSFCPCAGYLAIHPQHARDKPYYKGSPGMATDVSQAEASTQKFADFDGDERVLAIIAHDNKIESVIDVYPQEINQWKAKNWKQISHWRFLSDFKPKEEA